MGLTHPIFRRAVAAASAVLIVTSGLTISGLTVPQSALADTAPQPPNTSTTVSTDSLPTVQIDGVVYDQAIVGDTVYAGGSFATARPAGAAPGVNTVPRTNLLAFSLSTGDLITSFNHTLNQQVKAIAASPDGKRIYVGGQFTTVDGVTRNRIAAFDTATGALISSFAPAVNYIVASIVATNTTVYIGGSFSNIGSAPRTRVAALSASNGAVLPFTAAIPDGSVLGVVVSPDEKKVVIGGSFTSVNGQNNPGYGLAALDATTGASLPWNINRDFRNGGPTAAVYSLASDGDSVYGSGYHFGNGGNAEGAFRADWANGDLVWIEDCHGDTYSVAATATAIYTAGHPHYCGNSGGFPQTDPWTFQRAMAWSKAPSGRVNTPDIYGYPDAAGKPVPDLLTFWPDLNSGSYTGINQGPWDVTANSKYVLYGGEFTTVNFKGQQGLSRFATSDLAPNKDAPRLSGANFVPTAVSLAAGSIRLSWLSNYDRDNQYLTYDLIRNGTVVYSAVGGSRLWFDRPQMGYVDQGLTPGSTYAYRLRATDPFGNIAYGNTINVVASNAAAGSNYSRAVTQDGAASYWRLGESSGSSVFDWAGFNDSIAGSGVARGAAGAIANDPNTASTFSGDGNGLVSTQTSVQGPDTFAIEAWIKTTSTTGGKVVGFGNAKTGNSSSYDRHVYMDGDGRVMFGVYPGTSRILQSAPGFNDGSWHQITANLGATGMQLYIDGTRVGQRSDTTFGQSYSGYWRIGGDSTWSGDNYFDGVIDDVAIYNAPMTAQTINNHRVLSGRQSTIPAAPSDPYGASVFGDAPDFYWRLGESTGSTAADVMGGATSSSTGLYSGGVSKGAAGAISGTTNDAATFDGTNGLVSSSRQYSNPQVYSLEAWFKTSTSVGGKIIGFGRDQTGNSSSYDRHVYMTDDGKVVFGTYTGQLNTITTGASYNDNKWHHVVATQSSAGLRLYLDGTLEGTNPTTQAEGYDGYWRVGGDTTWGSSSAYFAGQIDEVAVYGSAISASTVQTHFALGSGGTPNSPPTASFTSTMTDLSLAVDASASSDTDGSISSYSWDFGDGSSASGPTASHTYANPGNFTVKLSVKDNSGSVGTLSRIVTAAQPNALPVASFTSVISGLQLSANGSGSTDPDGTVGAWAWNFGDGSTASGANTSHTYTSGGTFAVTLTVTDDRGGMGTLVRQMTVVAPNSPPTAAFTASSTALSASFDGSTSTDADGMISLFSWSFGDGASSTGATTSHGYATAGTYNVTLTVTDNGGATATSTKAVTVTAGGTSTSPIATDSFNRTVTNGLGSAGVGGPWTTSGSASLFSVDGSVGRLRSAVAGTNLNAYLSGASSSDVDISAVVGLAQAASGSGSHISVIGRRIGAADYRARVVISSSGTVSLRTERTGVTLNSLTVPGLTYATGDALHLRLQVVGGSPTTLRAKVWKSGSAEPASWLVTSTDSTTELQAAGQVGIGSYTSGSSTVLPVTTTFDDLSVVSASGAVAPPPANVAPVAAFTSSAAGLNIAADASGSADSDGTIADYAWAFGDGATGSGPTISHPYAAAGSYTVTLTVTDNSGATNAISKQLTVTNPAQPPAANVLATDTFARSATSSWGQADVGGAWTTSGGAANFAVNAGSATMRIPASGTLLTATLNAVSSTTTDMLVKTTVSPAVTGNGAYISLLGRKVGNVDYRAQVVVLSTGQVNLILQGSGVTLLGKTVAGLTYAAGDQLQVRLQVTGTAPTTIRAKVWKAGTPEPGAWTSSVTDATPALQAAGNPGLGAYLGSNATALPVTVGFSDLQVIVAQ